MAEKKKKKSIYSRKLKDVNKDGKKNFGDTWLGDMIGADGKAGIQKGRPGLKASIKGARREDGKADTTAKKAKETGKTTLKKISADGKGKNLSKLLDEKGKTPRIKVDKTDDARAKRTRATEKSPALKTGPSTRQGPRGQAGLKYKGVTYSEYLDIMGNNALKRAAYGLPANLSRTEFMRRAKAAQKKREVEARKDKTDDARAKRTRVTDVPGKNPPQIPGLAKGGMAKKRAYKAGGVVRSNCGASTKPNRKTRK